MVLDKVTDNPVVKGTDGGRGAANLNYILYLVAFVFPVTSLVAVGLAYSNRDAASETIRSHFNWQIKIFWRSVKFLVVTMVLYFLFTLVAVVTLGLGFVLYIIPFAIGIWWLISTIMRVVKGMKALGLGQPVGLSRGDMASLPPSGGAAFAPPAPTVSDPPAGWYDDSARGGHKRWWDGAEWGIRDDEHPAMASSSVAASTSAGPEAAVVATTVEPVPEATSEPQKRFCGNCGAERRPGGRFCASCGSA